MLLQSSISCSLSINGLALDKVSSHVQSIVSMQQSARVRCKSANVAEHDERFAERFANFRVGLTIKRYGA
jgi:hypothetical protein